MLTGSRVSDTLALRLRSSNESAVDRVGAVRTNQESIVHIVYDGRVHSMGIVDWTATFWW